MSKIVVPRGRAFSLLLVAGAMTFAGCGSSSHNSSATSGKTASAQYVSAGQSICASAQRQLHAIPRPTSVNQLAPYFEKTLALGENELRQLRALHPPAQDAAPLRSALSLFQRQGAALRAAVRQIKSGGSAGNFLAKVNTLGKQVNADFRKAALPECAK